MYRTITFFGSAFQLIRLSIIQISHAVFERKRTYHLTTPSLATASTFRCPLHTDRSLHARHNFTREVWTVPFSLATTKGMDSLFYVFVRRAEARKRKMNIFFLFLWLLRCFTSPGARFVLMYSVRYYTTLLV